MQSNPILSNQEDGTEAMAPSLERAAPDNDLEREVGHEELDNNAGAIEEPRTFAAILEGLRSAEDTFYFIIEEGSQAGTRLQVDTAELMIGWDESGHTLSTVTEEIARPAVHVRKDWSGVMVQPENGSSPELNGQALTSAHRLRNGDQLSLQYPNHDQDGSATATLVFHEPASLIVLDSLLPSKLPPPIQRSVQSSIAIDGAADAQGAAQAATTTGQRYFGYFSILELLVMAAATLLLAAAIFFVLDNS